MLPLMAKSMVFILKFLVIIIFYHFMLCSIDKQSTFSTLTLTVLPAAMITSSSIFTGAINCVSEPTKTFFPMMVLCFLPHHNYM